MLKSQSKLAVAIVSLTTIFNALLAYVNANWHSLNAIHVVAAEAMLLLAAAGTILTTGKLNIVTQRSIVFFLYMTSASFWVYLATGEFYPKILRDIAIVVIFTALGSVCKRRFLIAGFVKLTVVQFLFLLFEWFATNSYVSFFFE